MRYFCFLLLAAALAAQQANFNLSSLDAILQNSISPLNPGLSLTLSVEGKVVYQKSFGRYEPDRVVPIASASKWLASAAILALVDDGKLALNDRADRYLRNLDPDKASITLRQLLSHTSGLIPDSPCLVSGATTLADCVNEILAQPLLFAPGTKFHYGNASLQVAARMAEVAAGKSWAELFDEKLAIPLDLQCTRIDAIGSLSNPSVANGVASCASDFTTFLQMIAAAGLHNSKRVLSSASVQEMTRNQTGSVPIEDSLYSSFGPIDPSLPLLRYGLGVWREFVDPSDAALEVGSQGAFGFSPWVDFPRHLTGVLSVQSSQGAIMETYLDIKSAVRNLIPVWSQRSLLPVNSASLILEDLAPGAIFTLFGNAIAPAGERTIRLASPTQVSRELDNLRVLVDGIPAPLIYSGWSQVSAVVPFELEGKASATVQLEQNGRLGPQALIGIAPASPALFTATASGRGRAAAVNEDGSLNSPSSPIARGSMIILFATGLGPVSPAVPTGHVPAAAAITRSPVQVTIAGEQAEVAYAGVAPGSVAGLYQINVRVPTSISPGPDLPVHLQVGPARSSTVVTLSVR